MIDLQTEQLISLKDAAKLIPNKPHPSTIWRWWKRGINGIKLETIVIGGQRYTSIKALQQFVDGLSRGDSDLAPIHQKKADRSSKLDSVERELDVLGL